MRGIAGGSDEGAHVGVPGHFADRRAPVADPILIEPPAEDAVCDFVVHRVERELGSILEDRLEGARHVLEAALHHRQSHAPVEKLCEATSGAGLAELTHRLWSVPEQRFELVEQVECGAEPGKCRCLRRRALIASAWSTTSARAKSYYPGRGRVATAASSAPANFVRHTMSSLVGPQESAAAHAGDAAATSTETTRLGAASADCAAASSASRSRS